MKRFLCAILMVISTIILASCNDFMHAHEFGTEWKNDDTKHWHECECGEKDNEVEHSFGTSYQKDGEGHWQVCECGYKTTKVNHTWDEGTVTTEATDELAGVKKYTCTVCQEVKEEAIPAKGHTLGELVAAVAPTCTKEGSIAYKECSTCDKLFDADGNEVSTIVVPALGHTEEVVAGKAATCTEVGLTEGKKCSVCGEVTVAQEEIAALGHTEEVVAGKAATCTEAGLTEGKKCSVCGEVTVAQEEIAALGHTEEVVAGKAATCTETGLTEGKKCSVCGEVTVAQEEIKALGHTEEVVAGKAATCTETGLTEGKKCSVCGEVTVAQEEIKALGHNEEVVAGKAATCTETGLTDGKKCSVCGEVIVAQEEIAALGHELECIAAENEHTFECSRCDYSLAEAHFGGIPTKTEQGTCKACGQAYGELADFDLVLDGNTEDWSEEVKANVLKGWHKDANGETRGLEYMAFIDDKYVYIYTRTITATNAAKSFDVVFANGTLRPSVHISSTTLSKEVKYAFFNENNLLENGLYETVSEAVIDKATFINSQGNIFLSIWFNGCDAAFAPLSWNEEAANTAWVLNQRSPWFQHMSHQKVTETGFDHYHDLMQGNTCGWCQEEIELAIAVDGDSSDWQDSVLATGVTSTSPNNIFTTAYIDEEFLYMYIEITYLQAVEPNYISIFSKFSANINGIRKNERFDLTFDEGATNIRPYCAGTLCQYNYCDCNNGFAKMAIAKKVSDAGKTVACIELVIDKMLFVNQNPTDANYGLCRYEMQVGPNLSPNQNLSSWAMVIASYEGLHNHNYQTKFDATHHWTECSCGLSTAKVAHSGGKATTTQKAVCEGCGQEYGELATCEHDFKLNFDATHHWTECECGETTAKEEHKGGIPTPTQKAICSVCEEEYGELADFVVALDGDASDWSEEVKANSLKGWYQDENGETRGLEYLAFYDEKYVYIYTKTITASNAAKGISIYFNKNGKVSNTVLSANEIGTNIAYAYFNENKALENGLYETVSEMVLVKSSYINTLNNIYLAITFTGCDDAFAPLSWHKEGLTTNWVLNHRDPSFQYMSHQKVTTSGFDCYHELGDDYVCDWCQDTVELGITVDGDSSDWSESILNAGSTVKGKWQIYATGYIDANYVYFYVEITTLTEEETVFRLFTKNGANAEGLRWNSNGSGSEDWALRHTAGKTDLHPFFKNATDPYYSDTDTGFVKYAMTRKTDASSRNVNCYEFAIARDLIDGKVSTDTVFYGKARFVMQITAPTAQNFNGWGEFIVVTENGFDKKPAAAIS